MLPVDPTEPSYGQKPLPTAAKTPYEKGIDALTIAIAASAYRGFRQLRVRSGASPVQTNRDGSQPAPPSGADDLPVVPQEGAS